MNKLKHRKEERDVLWYVNPTYDYDLVYNRK